MPKNQKKHRKVNSYPYQSMLYIWIYILQQLLASSLPLTYFKFILPECMWINIEYDYFWNTHSNNVLLHNNIYLKKNDKTI